MIATRLQATWDYLLETCADLELSVRPEIDASNEQHLILRGPSGERIEVDLTRDRFSLIEQVLHGVRFDFDRLPLLVRGDSKEIRLLTARIALAKLLPTVYSFTNNRYGHAVGTDHVRARFSAEIFREMAKAPGPAHLCSAFLGLIESPAGPLLAEELVLTCNLEARVKRYHIGSPLHRYRYHENHATARGKQPLHRWARFDSPLVCFDWRHPLHDEDGRRLADEPLSDDYAGVWIDDVLRAKSLARDTFSWIEKRFARCDLTLVDICFFIDRTGNSIYGEISPDCMRVRSRPANEAACFDKDSWRSGGTEGEVLARYQKLMEIVFGSINHNNQVS